MKDARQRLSAEMVLKSNWVQQGGSTCPLVTPQNIRRNNSARELSAFAESAMAVNRVVLQHMGINQSDNTTADCSTNVSKYEDFTRPPPVMDSEKITSTRSSPPPLGLSPPSESKILQRRQKKDGIGLTSSCGKQRNDETSKFHESTSGPELASAS